MCIICNTFFFINVMFASTIQKKIVAFVFRVIPSISSTQIKYFESISMIMDQNI